MDDTGIYHGHSTGVVKYDMAGNVAWELRDPRVHGVAYGCQVRVHDTLDLGIHCADPATYSVAALV